MIIAMEIGDALLRVWGKWRERDALGKRARRKLLALTACRSPK
jgi:hypothetical protein